MLGVDGGIYREIQLLRAERVPVGTIAPWFKATNSSVIPTGWAVCDGSTILPSNHDFPGVAGSIQLPNLINKFILGADNAKTIGAAPATVLSGSVDSASGAPGPQGTGGANGVALATSEMPPHDHGGGDHTHTINRQVVQLPTGGANYIINVRDQVTHTETTNSSGAIISAQGGGNAHENRPAFVGLVFICKIKYASTL